jgi:hypothetical protein
MIYTPTDYCHDLIQTLSHTFHFCTLLSIQAHINLALAAEALEDERSHYAAAVTDCNAALRYDPKNEKVAATYSHREYLSFSYTTRALSTE